MKIIKYNSPQLIDRFKKLLVKITVFTFYLLLFIFQSYSQNVGVGINITGAPPNSRALLDVDATGMNPRAGVLLPRMTTADRNAITGTIPESLIIYNTDTHCFEAYYNGSWVEWGCLASSSCGNPITDLRDGQSYNTLQIGTQCWMAQNLNYGSYALPSDNPQTSGTKYCQNLNGVADNTCPWGGLYEWTNLMNGSISCDGTCTSGDGLCDNPGNQQECAAPVQGLCPAGWHIPSHYEFTLFEQNVCAQNPAGSNCVADFVYDETTYGDEGTTEGSKLKSASGWYNGGNGTNSSGFNAFPAGESWPPTFDSATTYAYFWTSTTYDSNNAWYRYLNSSDNMVDRNTYDYENGMSVRCVKN